MNLDELYQELAAKNCFIAGDHIVYTSGKHGSTYFNKDAIFAHPTLTSEICRHIALHFSDREIDCVLGPEKGGIIVAQWVGYHLGENAAFAERHMGAFVLNRGYKNFVQDKKILVVEDVLTTGVSIRETISLVREHGGEVVGVGAICNRGGLTKDNLSDVPELFSAYNINLESWPQEACPLCQQGVPINTSIGKGRLPTS